MKITTRDLKKLRWQLAIAAGLVIAAAVIAYASLIAVRKAEAEHRTAASRHAQIDARLRQVRTEEEDIKNRAALFLHLQERGIIGEEKRLDWIEMLRDLQNRMRLPDMNYEISPQEPLEEAGGSDYALFASSMKLRLHLVHEGDLLDFLVRVQREAKAIVWVRGCNVARLPAGDSTKSIAQLGADCELDWITVKKADIVKQ